MPINDADRARADAWDAQKWEMVEHECDPHPADYAPRGPADMRIVAEIDSFTQQIVAWHMTSRYMLTNVERSTWTDGHILLKTLLTHGRDFQQGSGKATC